MAPRIARTRGVAVRAALSRHLARSEFGPPRIESELAEEVIGGTQRRAA